MALIKKLSLVLLLCGAQMAYASMEDGYMAYDAGKYDQALPLFKAEADKGDAYALFITGVMYEEGQGVKADFAEALKLYQAAVSKGNPEAQTNLGVLYYFGDKVEKEPVKGLALLHAAAAQNNGLALYNLYRIELDNNHQDNANDWLDKAAAVGYPRAQHALATRYYYGLHDTPQDFAKAVALYRLAAEQGLADAQYDLALSYYNGEGVSKDLDESHKWLMLAAKQNYAQAQYLLYYFYKDGMAVVKEEKEALRWLTKAVDNKHPEAMFDLSLHYEHGTLGVSRDLNKTWALQQESANLGYARAEFYLGYVYYYGDESFKIKPDKAKGLKWIRKAAHNNLNYAQVELAVILLEDDNLQENNQEALDWLKKAGDYYAAQRTLGIYYERGIGVPVDLKQAVIHYQKAAEQEDAQAQYNLALIYLANEELFGQQTAKAEQLIQTAADQGLPAAQKFLITLKAFKN